MKDTSEFGFLWVSEKRDKIVKNLSLLLLKRQISLRRFVALGSHSLVEMSEEVCKVEIAQRRMGLRGSLRVRREKRVRDQGGDEGVTVLDAVACVR